MTKKPKIPMLPSQLPQQKITLVAEMPVLDPMPSIIPADKDIKTAKKMSRNADYICQLEWAWGPMHSAINAFYLTRGRYGWVLWLKYFDDNYGRWDEPIAVQVCSFGNQNKEASAMLMLAAYLKELHDHYDRDHYHWINEDGLLSVAEIEAVGRHVWKNQMSQSELLDANEIQRVLNLSTSSSNFLRSGQVGPLSEVGGNTTSLASGLGSSAYMNQYEVTFETRAPDWLKSAHPAHVMALCKLCIDTNKMLPEKFDFS